MNSVDTEALAQTLMADEGFRGVPYLDLGGTLTIGFGRNLIAKPLTRLQASRILFDDINDTLSALDSRLSWWRDLDDVRQMVVANMAFNLGISGLLGFPLMLTALKAKDYETAAREMCNSTWAHQVGARALRLSNEMRTGTR